MYSSSKKQPLVARSSTEVEHKAISNGRIDMDHELTLRI